MVHNKSLRTIKFIIPLFAVILAVVSVFAFSNAKHSPVKKSPTVDYVWIRYNCAVTPAVQTFPSSPNFLQNTGANPTTGNFSTCTGTGNICAYRFLTTEVQNIDVNNKQPIPGTSLVGRTAVRCD